MWQQWPPSRGDGPTAPYRGQRPPHQTRRGSGLRQDGRQGCPDRYSRISCAVSHYALDFTEIVDAPIGIFAPVAGLFVATERGGGIPIGIVQVDRARAQ